VSQVKKWVVRFKQGEKTCEDQSRINRPLHFWGQPLRDFLQEFPFATAIMIAQHFDESRHTIKQILQWELGLWKFSRMWVPHLLTDSQRIERIAKAKEIFAVLQNRAEDFLMASWLVMSHGSCTHISPITCSQRGGEVIPREKQTIRITLDWLPRHQTYTHNYFIGNILSDIVREKIRFCCKHRRT
jgi:hypothetical protein